MNEKTQELIKRLKEMGFTYINTEDSSEYKNQKQKIVVLHDKCKTHFYCIYIKTIMQIKLNVHIVLQNH